MDETSAIEQGANKEGITSVIAQRDRSWGIHMLSPGFSRHLFGYEGEIVSCNSTTETQQGQHFAACRRMASLAHSFTSNTKFLFHHAKETRHTLLISHLIRLFSRFFSFFFPTTCVFANWVQITQENICRGVFCWCYRRASTLISSISKTSWDKSTERERKLNISDEFPANSSPCLWESKTANKSINDLTDCECSHCWAAHWEQIKLQTCTAAQPHTLQVPVLFLSTQMRILHVIGNTWGSEARVWFNILSAFFLFLKSFVIRK